MAEDDGVALDAVGDVQDGREGVGELQDARCRDDGGEAGEIGNGGADDESDGPVAWDDGHPEEFAGPLVKRRGAEEFDGDVVVQDFDADVAV